MAAGASEVVEQGGWKTNLARGKFSLGSMSLADERGDVLRLQSIELRKGNEDNFFLFRESIP